MSSRFTVWQTNCVTRMDTSSHRTGDHTLDCANICLKNRMSRNDTPCLSHPAAAGPHEVKLAGSAHVAVHCLNADGMPASWAPMPAPPYSLIPLTARNHSLYCFHLPLPIHSLHAPIQAPSALMLCTARRAEPRISWQTSRWWM